MSTIIRNARSVCPVCLKPINAQLVRRADGIHIEKTCLEHGLFTAIIWRDKISFDNWVLNAPEIKQGEHEQCPTGCDDCNDHLQGSCCVLLEVTNSCNLSCNFCFADAKQAHTDKTTDELKNAINNIMSGGDKPLLQFSGGEPTLRDDLPELIAYAHNKGCKYTQLNTNGLRLAEDEAYVKQLANAGLSFVFMQFDGNDDANSALRNARLYNRKLSAIKMCDKYNIGVTLVPTIVKGINNKQIGDIISLGASLSPAVRGVHFQPATFLGRYPNKPINDIRYTLDELIADIVEQSGIDVSTIIPSRCDHPLCGFHGSYIVKNKKLRPITSARNDDGACTTDHNRNREYIGSKWKREKPQKSCCCSGNTNSLDDFLYDIKTNGFTITAMQFQDAETINIERLRQCSLHVYDNGIKKPFCAKYLVAVK